MTTHHRTVLIAAAAAGVLGTALPATAVSLGGSDGVRYAKASATLQGDAHETTTEVASSAYCDKGWVAVAGGQKISAKPGHAISGGATFESRYWYAEAWQQHTADSTFTSYAVCLKTSGLSASSTSEPDLVKDSQVTQGVYCSSGHAVAGGLRTTGEGGFALNASYPFDSSSDSDTVPDDGWRSYTQYSGEGGDSATFDAFCLDGPEPAYRSETVAVPASSVVTAQALCPKDRPVIGGGVYVTGAANRSHVVDSRPWDGGDTGTVPEDGWRGGVSNTSDGDLVMTVHAICR